REAWLSRAVGIGSPITVRLPAGSIDGRFEGLDDAGRLILDAGGTVHIIAAGDVFIHRERP
ncbi:MAG: biotin--[acetyl-CoA-carboxylase] ligase, partial [Pseudomonadota bacterium]